MDNPLAQWPLHQFRIRFRRTVSDAVAVSQPIFQHWMAKVRDNMSTSSQNNLIFYNVDFQWNWSVLITSLPMKAAHSVSNYVAIWMQLQVQRKLNIMKLCKFTASFLHCLLHSVIKGSNVRWIFHRCRWLLGKPSTFFLKTKGTLFDAPLEDDDVLDEGAVL